MNWKSWKKHLGNPGNASKAITPTKKNNHMLMVEKNTYVYMVIKMK